MLFVFVFSLLSAADAGERSKTFQVSATAGQLAMGLGEPIQRNLSFRFSTQLSELIVVDANCGKRSAGCPTYCSNARFAILYCSFLCRQFNEQISELNCGFEFVRYNSTQSNMSVLANARDWTKKLYKLRPLQGQIYSDRFRLNQYWRSSRPTMEMIRILDVPFVSALLYDNRLSSAGSAVFGLRPGPNSAALNFLKSLGAQRQVLSLASARYWDVLKPFIDIVDLYVTFGAVDNFRCVDWRWSYAPEFVVTASRVDFMGVEFRNLVFDLSNYVYSIPPKVAEILVDARILKVHREVEGSVVYSYIIDRDRPIRFLSASGVTFLQIGYQMNYFNESPVIVDPMDISSDPRGEQLIFNMGLPLLDQSCLAYDYANNRVGFAQRRPWSHPLYPSRGLGFNPGRPPWPYHAQGDGSDGRSES